jgi:diguanylate cyclase (GGDEF)-like protein
MARRVPPDMIMLDVRTLLVPLVLTAILSAVALCLVNRQNLPVPGVSRWAIGHVLGAIGMIFSAARDVLPSILGIVASNALIVLALVFLLAGFEQFVGRRSWVRAGLVLSGLVTAALAYFTYIQPSIVARVMAMSLASALLCGATAITLLRSGPSPVLVRQICGIVNLALSLFYAVRFYVASGDNFTDYFTGATFIVGVHLFGFVHQLTLAFTQLILISEWLNADLKRQASIDPLTGALNRRAFTFLAGKSLSRSERSNHSLSVLLCDLDHFKRVNDTRGHAFGDQVLCRFASVVLSALRVEDSFCRYGGEEFVTLLPDTRPEEAVAVAERLRRAYEVEASTLGINGTVSVGVAYFVSGDTLESLIRRADLALYQAKAAGRNCTILARDDAGIAFVPAREVLFPA